MKKIFLIFFVIFLYSNLIEAADPSVQEIVRKRDEVMRGESSFGEYEMVVISPRWERTVRFKAWSKGTERSFIDITYPKKDKGITFLRIKTDMWQYIPKIERTIKIPPSMMLQSWMGSDFTNDDLVKESSIVDDYTHILLKEDEKAYVIESTPKPQAAVVWGKIIQWIDKEKFIPFKDEFYDEDGVLIKRLLYDEVQRLPDRFYPMLWTVQSLTEERQGHKTLIKITELQINIELDENIFSRQALKKYSR